MGKKTPGPEKLDWGPFDDELWRRLENGEALETVTDEAKYLAEWARKAQHSTKHGTYQQWERIRDRIRRRYNGAEGYKELRRRKLDELLAKLKQRQIEATID